ncbi:TIGR03943 family putative permease subunit [Agromyces binzhouensis]|uniref:TIGR03943 family putative permease subunit n=1 Tax=Agromyces binzhouensis TaxID=1817495 RepID=UPI00362C7E91
MSRWKGVALTLVSVVATLWLAATGQLGLYINPDSSGFTVIMTLIGGILALAALALAPARDDHHDHDDHGPDHRDHEPESRAVRAAPARRRTATASAIVVVAGATVALLVLPPATLTARTAMDRDVEVTAAELAADAPSLAGADPSTFDLSDWALIANQFDDPAEFGGIELELAGFVSPVPGDPDDSFYITRFKITHCAIDAQPVGVPVHLPGWKERFAVDDWVVGTGELAADPVDRDGLVLVPGTVGATDEPEQPYVY